MAKPSLSTSLCLLFPLYLGSDPDVYPHRATNPACSLVGLPLFPLQEAILGEFSLAARATQGIAIRCGVQNIEWEQAVFLVDVFLSRLPPVPHRDISQTFYGEPVVEIA